MTQAERLTHEQAGARSGWWLVAGLTLVALLLRLIRLDTYPVWYDEAYFVIWAQNVFHPKILLADLVGGPGTPVLLWLWGMIDTSDWWYRFFSVLTGTATVPLLYRLVRRVSDRWVGVIAAAFLALSPMHVAYSQTIRKEGLYILCIVLALDRFERALRTGRRAPWIQFVLIGVFCVLIQPLCVPLLAGMPLFAVVLAWRGRRPIKGWITAMLVIGGTASLQLGLLLIFYIGRQEKMADSFGLAWMAQLVKTLMFGYLLPRPMVSAAAILVEWTGLLGLYRLARRDKALSLFVFLALLMPVAMIASSAVLGAGLLVTRYFVFMIPIGLFVLAYGLRHLRSPILAGVLVASFLCLGSVSMREIYQNRPGYQNEFPLRKEHRQMTAFIQEQTRPGDVIVHYHRSSFISMTRYTRDLGWDVQHLHPLFNRPECAESNRDSAVLNYGLSSLGLGDSLADEVLTKKPGRIWYVVSQWQHDVRVYEMNHHPWRRTPSEVVLHWLESRFRPLPFEAEKGKGHLVYRQIFGNKEWLSLYLFDTGKDLVTAEEDG